MDQNCHKVLLVLTHIGIQSHSSSTLPISFYFHQDVNLDSFIFESDCSFPILLKYDLYIEIVILKGQKWQKCFQFRHLSKFQLILLENYSFEFLYQVLNWRFHTITWLFHCKIHGFIRQIGLNSSIKISTDNFFLLKTGFSFKNNCSMFNLSFMSRLDGKYRNATAPFVFRIEIFALKSITFLIKTSSLISFFLD